MGMVRLTLSVCSSAAEQEETPRCVQVPVLPGRLDGASSALRGRSGASWLLAGLLSQHGSRALLLSTSHMSKCALNLHVY